MLMQLRFTLPIFFMLTSLLPARSEVLPLLVGSYTKDASQGISLAHFDTQSGELKGFSSAAATASPTFLALHPGGKFLYAVNENGAVAGEKLGGLSAFEIIENKILKPLNAVAAGGGLCHLSIDATGHYLLAAAYTGGSFEVWSLKENGEIGARIEFLQHPAEVADGEKPKKPRGHQFTLSPDNRFAFGVDLGLDKVFIYRFDAPTGKLAPMQPAFVETENGAGPRHMVFDKAAKFAYLINEHGNTITVFRYDSGVLGALQTVATLPPEYSAKSYTAEIAIHPNGRFLYGSNRGRDSIVVFEIDAATGKIRQIGEAFTEGRFPRHFTFSPDGNWLLVANQNDSSITVFRVDSQSGQLEKTSFVTGAPHAPVCLLFLPQSTPVAP
jgi:6-phosphogluconolactonase